MRSMSAAVLVALLFWPRRRARPRHDGDLREYARGTWASFVAMTDERTGLPADSLHKDGTRSVQTSTTNIGAYMWSAVVAHRLGLISRVRAREAALEDAVHAEGDGALGRQPVLELVRPPDGREARLLAAEPRGHLPQLAVVGRQRMAGGRPARRREQRAGAVQARRRALQGDGLRHLLRARAQPRALPHRSRAIRTTPRAATTPPSARAGSSTTSASRDDSCRRRRTSSAGGRSHPPAITAGWRRSRSAGIATTSASVFSRGHISTATRSSCPLGAGACSRR